MLHGLQLVPAPPPVLRPHQAAHHGFDAAIVQPLRRPFEAAAPLRAHGQEQRPGLDVLRPQVERLDVLRSRILFEVEREGRERLNFLLVLLRMFLLADEQAARPKASGLR